MIPASKGTIVLCDANVQYGSLLRSLLMWLGVRHTLVLRWSAQIQAEWITNLLEQRPDLSVERLARTCAQMNQAIPEALFTGDIDEDAFELPDPNDRHVLAVAAACRADILATFNLADFPAEAIPPGLRVVHPDALLCACLESQPEAVMLAVRALRANLQHPPLSPIALLTGFERAGLPMFSAALRNQGFVF